MLYAKAQPLHVQSWLMLTQREIILEVCLRAGVPVGRFRCGDMNKDEVRAVIRSAQVLSEHELEEFEEILREIRLGATGAD